MIERKRSDTLIKFRKKLDIVQDQEGKDLEERPFQGLETIVFRELQTVGPQSQWASIKLIFTKEASPWRVLLATCKD